MNSFSVYAKRASEYARNRGMDFTSADFQKWVLYGVLIPAGLFILLSPGLLVNIPLNTKGRCAKLIPLPDTTITNDCTTPAPDSEIIPICTARQNCNSFWVSGYTSIGPIIVHAFIFVFVAVFLMYLIRRQQL